VPDADVTAHSLATNQEFTGKTNSLGYLELRSIPPGGYRVTVSSKSFRNLVISRADVVVAQNTDLGVLKMEIGTVGETVQVEGIQPLPHCMHLLHIRLAVLQGPEGLPSGMRWVASRHSLGIPLPRWIPLGRAPMRRCPIVDWWTTTRQGCLTHWGNPIPPTPTTKCAVRWIYNDDVSSAFFKTPYGNVGRNPGLRGDAVNTVSFTLAKNFKFSERLSLRMEAQAYNLFNHRLLGVPDPFIDDLNLANGGTFANNFSNSSGGDYTNVTAAGLGRRRLILGGRITF